MAIVLIGEGEGEMMMGVYCCCCCCCCCCSEGFWWRARFRPSWRSGVLFRVFRRSGRARGCPSRCRRGSLTCRLETRLGGDGLLARIGVGCLLGGCPSLCRLPLLGRRLGFVGLYCVMRMKLDNMFIRLVLKILLLSLKGDCIVQSRDKRWTSAPEVTTTHFS